MASTLVISLIYSYSSLVGKENEKKKKQERLSIAIKGLVEIGLSEHKRGIEPTAARVKSFLLLRLPSSATVIKTDVSRGLGGDAPLTTHQWRAQHTPAEMCGF